MASQTKFYEKKFQELILYIAKRGPDAPEHCEWLWIERRDVSSV
jgi:hypothetical protein